MNINDLQKMMDAMSEQDRKTRSGYHVTLGQFMDFLKEHPHHAIFYGNPHSYRGYYSDLALEVSEEQTASKLYDELQKDILDKELTGYKGGDFLMDKDTPLWVAVYGSCGEAVVRVYEQGGKIFFETKDV